MKRGRPTKYGDHILEGARDYLANFAKHGDVIPSIAGLSVALGIGRKTLYEWRNHEARADFSHILAQILVEQERTLLNKGLNGEFNSNIVKLALGKHGYSEKQDLYATGGFNITIDGKDAKGL